MSGNPNPDQRPEPTDIRSDTFFGLSIPDAIRKLLHAMHTHHSTLFAETRLVKFAAGTGTEVRELTGYREAHDLIERYREGTL